MANVSRGELSVMRGLMRSFEIILQDQTIWFKWSGCFRGMSGERMIGNREQVTGNRDQETVCKGVGKKKKQARKVCRAGNVNCVGRDSNLVRIRFYPLVCDPSTTLGLSLRNYPDEAHIPPGIFFDHVDVAFQ
jgi:hypothetical protein